MLGHNESTYVLECQNGENANSKALVTLLCCQQTWLVHTDMYSVEKTSSTQCTLSSVRMRFVG